jgi:hypothetical protein
MTTKGISIAQKNLTKLIKSYFNLYFSKKLLHNKRILTRFKKLAVNKIFISKVELKYTSTKVIINLYIYNEERRRLIMRLKRMQSLLFPLLTNISIINREEGLLPSLEKRLNFLTKEDVFSFLV